MVTLIIALVSFFPAAIGLRRLHTHSALKRAAFQMCGPAEAGPISQTAFRSFSNNTKLSATDHSLCFTGARASTAILPDARICGGRVYSISNYSTVTPTPILTITAKHLQFIEGQQDCSLPLVGQSVMLISDGVNWNILRQFIPSSSSPWKTKAGSISYRNATAEKSRPAAAFYDISGN